jgi:predicted dehydrogenase
MQRYRSPAIELYGSDGTVQLLGDDWAPQGYELWRNDVGAWQTYYETDPFWPWTDGLRHAIECIERKTPPVCTPEHAFHVLEIVTRARQAAQDGVARVIESRFTPPQFPIEPSETVAAHLVHDPRGRRH